MAIPKEEPRDAVLPPAPPVTKAAPKPSVDHKARKDALKSLSANRRASAWQIHRWPYEKRIVYGRTRVHLPRTYLAQDGVDVRIIRPGQDLNQFVHRYYLEEVEKDSKERGEWTNYVTADGVVARRHEYLGPDPRVAGFHWDANGEIHIKWWDAFLQDQWTDKQKWSFEVMLNEDGEWVEIDD
ncbi:hypothetical protein WOLCODRAFT_77534 [Wolfiporia cocos MD-104 SS10]|uniref:Uncharacterized protein n=1 Tax=Wolfiporia cocos (strain MD-104) TaxID=742152 RepID=A0A2H3K7T8_WOLCO|nr:hypothetical protein WOLCODRAFT_77534 [Wolfiporia cocos MD-104 SS10]